MGTICCEIDDFATGWIKFYAIDQSVLILCLLRKYKAHVKFLICFREVQAKNEVTDIITRHYMAVTDILLYTMSSEKLFMWH